jgi:hypothetical protein
MRRPRNWRRQLVLDFLRGLSFIGLARKYGITSLEAQQVFRENSERRR